MKGEREVAGVRCGFVLERLTEYLDGELGAAERMAIEGHVLGCEQCARFGGVFSASVHALRRRLVGPKSDAGIRARLDAVLDRLERA